MISIGLLFLFLLILNVLFTVLLGEMVRPLSAARESNLLVNPCYALDATLWLLVVMYIVRSSAKSDPSTPFLISPNMTLIATRKRVTQSTLPCGIFKSICLLCEMDPPTLILIHLSISSLITSIIIFYIPMFSRCSSVFSLLTLSYAFTISKRLLLFSLFSWIHREFFFVIYDIAFIVLLCFLKPNCLSSIFLSFSWFQTSLLFIILLNILQSMFVRTTGL